MQFTPQQLTGGPRYAHKCRIGNWSEDLELEEIKLKDYLKKKECGALIVNEKQAQLEASLKKMELSAKGEKYLHFGDRIMLFNHQSKGFMAVNPHDSAAKAHDCYMLTTCRNATSCVRNVFELERADHRDGFEGDVVHYGQTLRCKTNPFSTIKTPTYMHSELVTSLAAAKFSRHQEVTTHANPSGETLWQVLFPDTQTRFEMEGEPVEAGSPCVLRHVHTGHFLASDEIPYHNLFGQEFEVHCYAYHSLNKTHNLTSEKKGEITGDYALRRHGIANIWNIVNAEVADRIAAAEAGCAGADDTQRP